MTERILIVEDNLALAENVAELLRDEGAEVYVTDGAASAEAIAKKQELDLAIVDIRLAGGASGLDLVPRLKLLSVHGEILLMTGDATIDSAIQAIRRGVYAYITKPFEAEQLVALVKRALAQVALKRERHTLEKRLRASEALYRGVVESVEACILGLDSQGIVQFTNGFAEARMAEEPGELVGQSFAALCDAGDGRELARAITRATSGHPVRDVECRLRAAPGRTVRWTLTPLATGGEAAHHVAELAPGSVRGVVLATGIDITERLDLERKSAEAEAMAAMGVLTTGLAHEIRNPLNAANLQLELLMRRARRSPGSEVSAQLLAPAELVQTEIERLSALLDEFLDLARPRPLERRVCSVAALFEGVLALEQPVAQAAGALLRTKVTPADLTVRADADKLKQVLINLVANAVDALRERGSGLVELSAERDTEGRVVITVVDDGPGISPELAERAFKPFVTSKPAGTGLGLSIVRKIVAQHGGTTELLPRPEGGTMARFHLPA